MAYIQEYAATDRFCKSYVEQLEKQVGEASRSASSFPMCSYKFRRSAPSSPQGELHNSSPSIGGLFACMPALNPTENTFGEDPDAPLRVAKMQDVHSLLVFRFVAKLSLVHSFLLRGINFAEVLFLWRIRSRRDLIGAAAEPEPRNTPFRSRRKSRIHTFMSAPVRTDRIPIRTTRKKNGAYYRKNTRRSALIFRSKPGSCCRFSCRG